MKKILLSLIIISTTLISFAQVGLIIGDGQSNMQGVLPTSSEVAYNYRMSPNALIFDSTTANWQYMINFPKDKTFGLNSQATRGASVNPFIALGNKVDSITPREYYFAMRALGGTQMYQEAGVVDWNVNSINEHYDIYIDYLNLAISKLSKPIDTIYRIKFQGEADAQAEVEALVFYQNENDFIDSLEANFNYPFQHYLIEITDTYIYSATVNGALAQIASERANVTLYENTDFVYSGVHITSPSQITLGDSLFQLIHF